MIKINELKEDYKIIFAIEESCDPDIIIKDNLGVNVYNGYFSCNGTEISCGIYQLSNFSSDISMSRFDSCFKKGSNFNFIYKKLFLNFIVNVKRRNRASMILMSNNKINNTRFNKILDSCTKNSIGYKINHNSGNKIKLWIL